MNIKIAVLLDPAYSDGYTITTLTDRQWSEWARDCGDYHIVGDAEIDLASALAALAPQADDVIKDMEQKAIDTYTAAMSNIADFKAKMLCLGAPR